MGLQTHCLLGGRPMKSVGRSWERTTECASNSDNSNCFESKRHPRITFCRFENSKFAGVSYASNAVSGVWQIEFFLLIGNFPMETCPIVERHTIQQNKYNLHLKHYRLPFFIFYLPWFFIAAFSKGRLTTFCELSIFWRLAKVSSCADTLLVNLELFLN